MRRFFIWATLSAGTGLVLAACTIHQTDVPPVTGPSTFALSMSLTATPDSIVQNGSDKSTVRVYAYDAYGRPLSNLGVQLQVTSNGLPVDYGTLSARTIYTGTDGTATSVYTSPTAPPPSVSTSGCHGLSGPCVTIVANAIGSNYENTVYNHPTADIRLTPPAVPTADPSLPQALFTVSTATPSVGTSVTFNGASSTAGSGHQLVSYVWNFGDGTQKSGVSVTHDYGAAGTYSVMLTVTNEAGQTSNIVYGIIVS